VSDATLTAARTAPARPAPAPAPRPKPNRERPRPDLRVVPRRVRRRRAGLAVCAMCLAVFGLLFGLTTFQAMIARNQMQLDRTQQRLAEAKERQDALRLQVARQESPEYVIGRATGELGMVPTEDITYVTPAVGQVQEVGAAAAGAPPLDPAATPVVVPPADPSQLPG
jgi:cell division protein FtsB